MKRQRNNRGHGGHHGGGGHSNNYRGGGGGGGGGGGQRSNVPFRAQTFDSSGPDVRIRGNAFQVLEKYLALARDASGSGDRVAAENYYQHAEHYFRMINANQEQFPQQRPPQQGYQGGPQQGQPQQGGYAPNGDGQPVPGMETPGMGPQPGPVVTHTQPHLPNVAAAAPQGAIQQGGPLPSFLAAPGGENN
ncbi:MAG: DUF4167 domain-containing protein [Tagaea sp.]